MTEHPKVTAAPTYLPSVPSVFLGPETFPFRYVTLRYMESFQLQLLGEKIIDPKVWNGMERVGVSH